MAGGQAGQLRGGGPPHRRPLPRLQVRYGGKMLLDIYIFHIFSPPPGFCFDSLCRDVIMDDSNLEDYNFDEKVGFKDKDKD